MSLFKPAEGRLGNDTYIIAAESSLTELQRKVNKLIDKGYRPVGGLTQANRGILSHHVVCQALVKEVSDA